MKRNQKLNKMIAQMEMSCDQLWEYAQEDEILGRIDQLREDYIDSPNPSDKEMLICICATLVVSEVVKRRAEKEKNPVL